ncbi:hypothetical protein ABIE69_001195 [Rhodobacteraceae bacterium MBR-64]
MRSGGIPKAARPWPGAGGVLLVMVLAGCLPATKGGAPDLPGAPAPISTTALPALPDTAPPDPAPTTAAPGATQTAEEPAPETAKPGPPPLPVPTTLFGRKVQDDLQRACAKSGGRFGPRGTSGALACFITPPDAGQSCTRKSDCTGQCLARSNTCSPVIPLIGCHEILTTSGVRVTECLE